MTFPLYFVPLPFMLQRRSPLP